MVDDERVQRAAQTAELYVAPLGRRWFHVQAVAEKARIVAATFGSDAAGWLRRLISMTSAMPLIWRRAAFIRWMVGRFVRATGFERMVQLVAHHSGARLEAALRGIPGYEDEFPFVDDDLDRALTYCD